MYTIIGGDGREYGPVSAEQVRQWIAAGRANGQTRAKVFGTEEWKQLSDFSDFSAQPFEPPALENAPFGAAEPVLLGPPLASRLRRLAAVLIDGLIFSLCCIPLGVAIPASVLVTAIQGRDASALTALPGIVVGAAISGLLWLALFVTQLFLLSLRGQTIGKLLLRIRIVRFEDGALPGFVRAFLVRAVVMSIFTWVPYIGFLVGIADWLFIFRDDRRCIHDHLAKTKVVDVV